jgi:hypothetical protein
LVGINQAATQFFGQSFSSSSNVGPNGQVVSNSIYTDSQGNRVINGQNFPAAPGSAFGSISSPFNSLLPPALPNAPNAPARKENIPPATPVIIPKPPPPQRKPAPAAVSKPASSASNKVPSGSKGEGAYVHDNSGAYRPDDRGQYKGN